MAFWNKRCHRPVFQPPMCTSRDNFTARDIAATAITRDLDAIPVLPEVPGPVARCNAITVRILLAKIAEVSRERR
jgi:hypothetical protein